MRVNLTTKESNFIEDIHEMRSALSADYYLGYVINVIIIIIILHISIASFPDGNSDQNA